MTLTESTRGLHAVYTRSARAARRLGVLDSRSTTKGSGTPESARHGQDAQLFDVQRGWF